MAPYRWPEGSTELSLLRRSLGVSLRAVEPSLRGGCPSGAEPGPEAAGHLVSMEFRIGVNFNQQSRDWRDTYPNEMQRRKPATPQDMASRNFVHQPILVRLLEVLANEIPVVSWYTNGHAVGTGGGMRNFKTVQSLKIN